jgi:hypothetical protein
MPEQRKETMKIATEKYSTISGFKTLTIKQWSKNINNNEETLYHKKKVMLI